MVGFFYENRKWVFVFTMVVALIALWPISKLNIDNSVEIWFYEKDPGLNDYKNYLNTFGGWDYLVKLGYSLRRPCPYHVKADPAAQSEFKKNFRRQWQTSKRAIHRPKL